MQDDRVLAVAAAAGSAPFIHPHSKILSNLLITTNTAVFIPLSFIAFLWICYNPAYIGLSPGSDAYQKLIKEAAALGPLVEGYQELQHKQQDVSLAVLLQPLPCFLEEKQVSVLAVRATPASSCPDTCLPCNIPPCLMVCCADTMQQSLSPHASKLPHGILQYSIRS